MIWLEKKAWFKRLEEGGVEGVEGAVIVVKGMGGGEGREIVTGGREGSDGEEGVKGKEGEGEGMSIKRFLQTIGLLL